MMETIKMESNELRRPTKPRTTTTWCRFKSNGIAVVLLFLCHTTAVLAFNIDTTYPKVFRGPSDTFFGYSVGFLKNANGSWIITGAPIANSTKLTSVVKPGEIFKCEFQSNANSNKKCEALYLNIKDTPGYAERKDNGWLGVSLDTTTVNGGGVVACAHRLSQVRSENYHTSDKTAYRPSGICYAVNGDLDLVSLETLRPFAMDQFRDGYGNAEGGASAQFVKNSDSLLIGAPSTSNGIGAAVLLNQLATSDVVKNRAPPQRSSVYTKWGFGKMAQYSYFGFAVTSGKFDRDGSMDYVIGAPRENYRGSIYILSKTQSQSQFDSSPVTVKGNQLGEYFGATLCAVDLNNDGLDDLLVGAPRHTKVMDEGKVYVFINEGSTILKQTTDGLLGSQIPSAQFGSSIAWLGDVNMDGYPDIAVGAPYESGRGAVYIYFGNGNGIGSHHSQKIVAGQAGNSAVGFGISIASGADIDGNNYPDLLVGAYLSNEVYVFRTKPLIRLNANLISNTDQLNMSSKNCNNGGTLVSCYMLSACTNFTGKFGPKEINVRLTLEVDTLKGNGSLARVLLKSKNNLMQSSETFTTRLPVNKQWCKNFEVHAKELPRDIMTTIANRLTYERIETDSSSDFCPTCALIDQTKPNIKTSLVRFTRHCGADQKCDADLQLSADFIGYSSAEDTLVVGSTSTISLTVDVFNAGEHAYATTVNLNLPEWMDIDYKPSTCDFTTKDKLTLFCQLPNLLEQNETSRLRLDLNLQRIPIENGFVVINITTKSDSSEIKKADNAKTLKLPVKVVAEINTTGMAVDQQVFFARDISGNVKENTTASFRHAYEITNKGPSPVSSVDILIKYPSIFLDSDVDFVSISVVEKRGVRGAIFGSCVDNGSRNRTSRQAGNEALQEKKRDDYSRNDTHFIVDCITAVCRQIICAVGPLAKDSSAYLAISATVDINKLRDFSTKDSARIFTEAHAIVIEPNIPDIRHTDYTKVFTDVIPSAPPFQKEPAKWIIPVCSIGGLLLLALIVTALVKVGFFRRKEKELMKNILREDNNTDEARE